MQELEKELNSSLYKNAEQEYSRIVVHLQALKNAGDDLQTYYSVLDQCVRVEWRERLFVISFH